MYRRDEKAKTGLIIFMAVIVAVLMGLAFWQTSGAAGYFQRCNYLNDCETFGDMGDFKVESFQQGIKVTGTVPDGDLAGSGNPIEIIITTGDVYTRCHNTKGVKKITGDLLWRGNVVPGQFAVYIPLEEGSYNITVYMGQSKCANCPQARVFPIKVRHNECDWAYRLSGNYPCFLLRNRELGDKRSELPARYDGTGYMQDLCNLTNRVDCDGNPIPDVMFDWSGNWSTFCLPLPPCTACP